MNQRIFGAFGLIWTISAQETTVKSGRLSYYFAKL